MDQNILGKVLSAELRLYAIWIKRLKRDVRASCDSAIFGDPRASVFWDGNQIMGKWFARAEGLTSVAWDTYYLYGPEAKWGAAPSPLVASGFPVVNFRTDLRKYLGEIVKGEK